jgi:hypothetical protein
MLLNFLIPDAPPPTALCLDEGNTKKGSLLFEKLKCLLN